MANNLVTEAYLAEHFTPKSGVTPGSDDHVILNCTEIQARYNVNISPSSGKYCPKQSEISSAATLPSVQYNTVTDIKQTTITMTGTVLSDGGSPVTERGFVYALTSTGNILPTLEDEHLACGSGTGDFLGIISGLTSHTSYYVRAYAINSVGVKYSAASISLVTWKNVGDAHAGGILAYSCQTGDSMYNPIDQHGIIAATSDLSASIAWDNGDHMQTVGYSYALGAGYDNTETIVSIVGSGSYAASICWNYSEGGYDDWFLGSAVENALMRENRNLIGGFSNSIYWSSTEHTSNENWAYGQDFSNTSITEYSKDTLGCVRPIRYF